MLGLQPDRGEPRGRRRLLKLPDRLRRALVGHEPEAFQLELAGSILIRYSEAGDGAALERLAALDSRTLPEGSFLLAEVDGELVVAAPLDVDAGPLKDPFRRTANVRELLTLQAGHVRWHRDAVRRAAEATLRALREAA